MSRIKWILLILLLLVAFDAAGDAFRLRGWQVIHHVMESVHVIGWIAVWALFRFNPVYIVMYLLGRFIAFDLIFNLIAGNYWWYVGESSLYGRGMLWFADLVKQPIALMVSMPKFMALTWWNAWFWTNRQFRDWKITLKQ